MSVDLAKEANLGNFSTRISPAQLSSQKQVVAPLPMIQWVIPQ